MAPMMRTCPYCEKEIPLAQVVCQHCGKRPEQFWRLNNRVLLAAGLAVAILLGWALLRSHF